MSSVGCQDCAEATSSYGGAASCTLSAVNYYLKQETSKPCPANAECNGGVQMPRPVDGFWIDRTKSKYADLPLRCARETCKGASGEYDDDDKSLNCWTEPAYGAEWAAEVCESDSLQCLPGSGGILCGSVTHRIQQHCARPAPNELTPLIPLLPYSATTVSR